MLKAGSRPNFSLRFGQIANFLRVGDIEDMATNLLSILANEDTLNEFKQNAFNDATTFDIKNILPNYENYYNSISNSYCFSNTKYIILLIN